MAVSSIHSFELSIDFLHGTLLALVISFIISFVLALNFQFSLRLSSLWEKHTLDTKNYRYFMLLILFPPVICFFIPDIFLGGIYEILMSYHYVAEFFILMLINIVILFIYFRVIDRKKFATKKNAGVISIIALIFISMSLFTEYVYLGGEQIYWQGNEDFNNKVKTFEIGPNEVDELLKEKELLIDTSAPMFIVQDSYFRPRLRKLRSPSMTGYYVNGSTGKIEYRETSYYFKDGIFGLGNKRIPHINFRTIEALN